MLAMERHAIILDRLREESTVSIRALTEALGVSRETVRKDIELLARSAKLEQVRGGATAIRTREAPMERRTRTNADGKRRIAELIASRIPDGASLMLDNGSSIVALAEALHAHRALTVFTNDLTVASMIRSSCAELVVIGGRVDLSELATFGIEALEQARRYRADFAVISAGGLAPTTMLTDFSEEGAAFRGCLLRNGATGFVIADREKFGVIGQIALPSPPRHTCIVTDAPPGEEIETAIGAQGLDLLIAE